MFNLTPDEDMNVVLNFEIEPSRKDNMAKIVINFKDGSNSFGWVSWEEAAKEAVRVLNMVFPLEG